MFEIKKSIRIDASQRIVYLYIKEMLKKEDILNLRTTKNEMLEFQTKSSSMNVTTTIIISEFWSNSIVTYQESFERKSILENASLRLSTFLLSFSLKKKIKSKLLVIKKGIENHD